MPLDLRPGMIVPIPCRHCARALIRVALEGDHRKAVCPKCGGVTEVLIAKAGESLQVRTSIGPPRAKPSD